MEMWLRISAFSDVAYLHGADQAWHREHAESLSAREVDLIRDLVARQDAFRTLFSGKAKDLVQAKELLRSSLQAIAARALEEAVRAYSKGATGYQQFERYKEIARTAVDDVETLPEWLALHEWTTVRPWQVANHPAFFSEGAAQIAPRDIMATMASQWCILNKTTLTNGMMLTVCVQAVSQDLQSP